MKLIRTTFYERNRMKCETPTTHITKIKLSLYGTYSTIHVDAKHLRNSVDC